MQNFSTLVLLINFFLKKATGWEGGIFYIVFFFLINIIIIFILFFNYLILFIIIIFKCFILCLLYKKFVYVFDCNIFVVIF